MHLGVGEALGSVVTSTAQGLSSLHSAGVPWYVCIPIAAACVNFSVRLPLQYYARRLYVEQSKLNPLVAAWASRHNASKIVSNDGHDVIRHQARISAKIQKSRARIYKLWGVQRWKNWAPLMGMVPFVLVSESLRRLCGAPLGALSQALGLGKVVPSAAEATASVASTASTPLFDATLSQGGALWFHDLTAMDPYFALPVLCTLILARNSWFRMPKERLRTLLALDNPSASEPPIVRIRKTFGRVLLVVPVFPLIFADLPSAVFLYWASSFSLAWVNETILDFLYPMPQPKEVPKEPRQALLLDTEKVPCVRK
jgi:inner membrane protein COX18